MWLNVHVKFLVGFCFAISTAQPGGSHSFKVLCGGETYRTHQAKPSASHHKDWPFKALPCTRGEGRSYWERLVFFNIFVLPKGRYAGQAYEAQLHSRILKEKTFQRDEQWAFKLVSLKDS